jgi:two-component system, NarL family, response regulator LiaR
MAIKVVIADDHPLFREGLRMILERSPDTEVVGEAADGEAVVALVRELCTEVCPDIVLMDIAMPGGDGMEATRGIKACCPDASVVFLSAFGEEKFVRSMVETGAAGFLLKDMRAHELVTAIRSVHQGGSVLSPSIAASILGSFDLEQRAMQESRTGESLTAREKEVLVLASRGLANKAIADRLEISSRTVQMHLSHIFEKLGVASRTEAVVTGLREGWLVPTE